MQVHFSTVFTFAFLDCGICSMLLWLLNGPLQTRKLSHVRLIKFFGWSWTGDHLPLHFTQFGSWKHNQCIFGISTNEKHSSSSSVKHSTSILRQHPVIFVCVHLFSGTSCLSTNHINEQCLSFTFRLGFRVQRREPCEFFRCSFHNR